MLVSLCYVNMRTGRDAQVHEKSRDHSVADKGFGATNSFQEVDLQHTVFQWKLQKKENAAY